MTHPHDGPASFLKTPDEGSLIQRLDGGRWAAEARG